MTTIATHYRATCRQRPYEGTIAIAELSLRFDYKWSEELNFDVKIVCHPLMQGSDDGSTYSVEPGVLIDRIILPVDAPPDRDFRKLDQLEFEFHQPVDPDGGRLYDLDAPGSILRSMATNRRFIDAVSISRQCRIPH